MEAQFQRVVFEDVWRDVAYNWQLGRNTLGELKTFQHFAIGWRLEVTQRELQLIQQHNIAETCVIHIGGHGFTMAEALGSGFIPFVTPSLHDQLEVQGAVMMAAKKWTMFFEEMADPVF